MSSLNSTYIHETQFVVFCFPGNLKWWKGLLGAVLLLLFLVALFANLSLLLVIWTDRRFHTPMYYFVSCLSLSDLAVCLIVVPVVLAGLWFDLRTINPSTCFLQIFFVTLLTNMQPGILLVMAYDRYFAICKPLQYPLTISNIFTIKAISVIFLRSYILVMPSTILPAQLDYCNGIVINDCFCNSLEVVALACDSNPIIGIYTLVVMVLGTAFEISFITFSYFKIIEAVLRLQSRGASSKAFNTCGSHVIIITFFYSSLIILIITNIYRDRIPSDIRTLITILFNILPAVINPIVYGFRTKGFMLSIMGKLKMAI